MRLLAAFVCLTASAQIVEVTVLKDSISVHTVRAGVMPLRVAARGTLDTAGTTPAITAALRAGEADLVRAGQPVVTRIAREELTGRVVRVSGPTAHIELAGSVPAGTALGTEVFVRIQYSQIDEAVFVERPVRASPNSEGAVFRVEAGAASATRVPVRFGRAAADLIQIRDGLKPGDKVIVSDTGTWSDQARVRLE